MNAQIMDYRKDKLIKTRRIELAKSKLQNTENTIIQNLLKIVKGIVVNSGVNDEDVKIRHMKNILKIDKTFFMISWSRDGRFSAVKSGWYFLKKSISVDNTVSHWSHDHKHDDHVAQTTTSPFTATCLRTKSKSHNVIRSCLSTYESFEMHNLTMTGEKL